MAPPRPGDRSPAQIQAALERLAQLAEAAPADADLRLAVGARWRKARERLSLTQREVAAAFGHGQSWCADLERGKLAPSVRELAVMAALSGHRLEWFLRP